MYLCLHTQATIIARNPQFLFIILSDCCFWVILQLVTGCTVWKEGTPLGQVGQSIAGLTFKPICSHIYTSEQLIVCLEGLILLSSGLKCQWARQSTLRASLLVDTHTSLRILKETSKQWICFCEYDCKHRCCSWCKAHVGVSNCFCDCVDWKRLWNPGTARTDLNWLEDDKYITRRRNALSAGGTGVDLSHSH